MFPDSLGLLPWVGATRSRVLQVAPTKPRDRFLQQLHPCGGARAPLPSLLRSQSFSCVRLSSVMPWAASSARTLSR